MIPATNWPMNETDGQLITKCYVISFECLISLAVTEMAKSVTANLIG